MYARRANKISRHSCVQLSIGAMFIVGHEALCRILALACRIESWIRFAKEGDSRQVSGTSDASKTRLWHIGS
jgi:hypothetical protein